ncbi:hypothetical protein GCM10022224_048920 [Nonomuraea antimicrobica]|uniref:Lactococcin 972 family bacteriocin n=1 Tax=Nonomuraea antimicrobica TaxID=561173 RepID=A0ABP7C3V5_9ACTN
MSGLRGSVGTAAACLGLMVPAGIPAAPAGAAVHAVRAGSPKDSGNSWKSGNYLGRGRAVNSGNFENANGAVKSNITYSGANYANGPQCVFGRKVTVKKSCWPAWRWRK